MVALRDALKQMLMLRGVAFSVPRTIIGRANAMHNLARLGARKNEMAIRITSELKNCASDSWPDESTDNASMHKCGWHDSVDFCGESRCCEFHHLNKIGGQSRLHWERARTT